MPFAKLDSAITKSSVWSETLHVRVVWVSFLAEKDLDGVVRGSRSGLTRMCNVTPEEYDDAVAVLSSPDAESQNPDHGGRRIEAIPGGWLVLNHEHYRLPEEQKRAATRERVRRFREREGTSNATVTPSNATKRPPPLPSVSTSVSGSESGDAPKKDKAKDPADAGSVHLVVNGETLSEGYWQWLINLVGEYDARAVTFYARRSRSPKAWIRAGLKSGRSQVPMAGDEGCPRQSIDTWFEKARAEAGHGTQ